MATAADVVRMQAELLEQFRTPRRGSQGVELGITTADGHEVRVPLSNIGDLVDSALYGETGGVDPYTAIPGQPKSRTAAPAVAAGLTMARAYRIQQNMTPAIAERADALPAGTVFGVEDDQITPPRPNGFAYFEELVPYWPDSIAESGMAPGLGLITWTCVAGAIRNGQVMPLSWVVVFWDDLERSQWADVSPMGRRDYGSRWVPITGLSVWPGSKLPGTPMDLALLPGAPVRSFAHVLAALWQMLGETVPVGSGDEARDAVETEPEALTRRDARRAKIAGMTAPPEVTTVILRRARKPVQNPGTGTPRSWRTWVEPDEAWRWVGSVKRGDRRRVKRPVRGHWTVNNEALPIRRGPVVNELRR